MAKRIIFFESYFIEFYKRCNPKLKEKIQYTFELIKQVEKVPEKFLKHISGTEGLYEIRVKSQSNIYRIFCCFDEGNLVVIFNAMHKKTQKTPQKEIEKALILKARYFQQKRKRNE